MKNENECDVNNWDWNIGKKEINIRSWKRFVSNIGELQSSSDGERLAIIAKVSDQLFQVYDTKELWGTRQFNKIWNLRFGKNGVSYACVLTEDGWTVAVDGIPWGKSYDYVWSLFHECHGEKLSIAAAIQRDMKYSMILNEREWSKSFVAMTYCTLSPDGSKAAAAVQIKTHNSGEIHKFKKNIYTVAVEGKPWTTRFLNVWNISISPNAKSIAAEVRLKLDEYTIAVDDNCWAKTYDCVWKPTFHPKKMSVVAPVRIGGRWGMAVDDYLVWAAKFFQLWQQKYSFNGNRLAAIVSPRYGKWTVVIDEISWDTLFDTMVTDLTFSHDGKRLAALAKHKNYWYVIVDDFVWNYKFDMAWAPVFSNDGKNVAAKVEINGRYTFVINNTLYNDSFDAAWSPKFNLDGDRLLLCVVRGCTYERYVVAIDNLR